MQIARKGPSVLALTICLLVALAFGASTAMAKEIIWPPDSVGSNTLTIVASGDQSQLEELDAADMTVYAYCIATGTPNASDQAFTYKYVPGFGEGELDAPLVTDADAKNVWEAIAEDALTHIKDPGVTPVVLQKDTEAAGTFSASGLPHGIYLIVVNADTNEPNVVYGTANKYTFQPQLVALPTKDPAGGVIASSNAGPWLDELAAYLKSEVSPLYGDIKITKDVLDFWGEESATFVYHLVGTTPQGNPYDNYAAITWPEQKETIVTHIPVGTVLTVTEISPVARFELVSGDSSEKTIVSNEAIAAGKGTMPEAAFVNKPNGSGKGGHGIENNFKLEQTGQGESAWEWEWSSKLIQDNSESQG